MPFLSALHRLGVNSALLAGLLLMPAVIGVGYWADGGSRTVPDLGLRGSFVPTDEPMAAGAGNRAAATGATEP